MGFFGIAAQGYYERQSARQDRRSERNARDTMAELDRQARGCLAEAQEALANGDSRLAQWRAQQGQEAVRTRLNILIEDLNDRW